jgi:hypothetical protein
MKSKLAVLFAFCFFSTASFAQFHLGVKAGTNISKIDGKSFEDEFAYGYLLGAFVELGKGKVTIQPEVLLNQYQTKVDSNFRNIYQGVFDSGYSKNIKLNYLSIPLVLNYKLGSLITLQGGPQYSIIMDKDKDLFQNGKDAFQSGDFSLLGGAEIRFAKIRITGRYVVGLNNINDFDEKDKWKSQAIQLSLGLAL